MRDWTDLWDRFLAVSRGQLCSVVLFVVDAYCQFVILFYYIIIILFFLKIFMLHFDANKDYYKSFAYLLPYFCKNRSVRFQGRKS